ncbi:DUF1501 domain-containing protein [Nitrospirillum pindoramense]|uniref:Uncharacterized protein (DUF1501 family) n=1 Tax=Nitrospirillum amazonense TaxID=28077 RepID=A0A560HBV4_9PROT|nr:DUF1501 domain-containing protein [Nitrospirillum amazonense]TWB43845.1 uncharacterized protein (DUF1501 family) [Nitrospirillum amazonense]
MTAFLDMNRRHLLASLGTAAAMGALPRVSFARTVGDQRFVLIVLRGGMDGLAAVAPYADRDYGSLRGRLALADPNAQGGVLDLNGFFGLNPALADIHPWYAEGQLLVAHAVATPYRDRSHFDAQDLLENGTVTPHGTETGWLNRAIGLLGGSPLDGSTAGRRLGLAVGQGVPLVLRGAAPVASWAPSPLKEADGDFLDRVAALYASDPLLANALKAGLESASMADHALNADADMSMDGAMADGAPKAKGVRLDPAQLGETTGRLLADANGPRIAALDLQGWDTHTQQGTTAGRLAGALGNLSKVLVALRAGLGPAWRQTVVAVVTEFGRTARPNGTGGTDHGTATAAFLAGGAVQGGRVLADWPGLADDRLYQGRDLAPTQDLRALMKGILREHLGLDGGALNKAVFPGDGSPAAVRGLIRT